MSDAMSEYEMKLEQERKEAKLVEQRLVRISYMLGLKPCESDNKERVSFPVMFKAMYEKSGAYLYFRAGGYQNVGRVRVSGGYPRDREDGYIDLYKEKEPDEISVSLSKSGEKIASDIKRRLYPGFLKNLEKVQEIIKKNNEYYSNRVFLLYEIIKKNNEYYSKRKENYGILAEAAGLDMPESGCNELRIYEQDGIFGQVRCDNEDARLELSSVPIDKAAKVLKFLMKGGSLK